MKVVKHNGEYKVVDSIRREVALSIPLNKLDDIFNAYWKGQVSEDRITGYTEITGETYSFKGLKHEVAGYLLVNGIEANISSNYVSSYERNKHLYCKTEVIYE